MRVAFAIALCVQPLGSVANSTTVGEAIELCEAAFLEEQTWQTAAKAGRCLGLTEGVARIMTLNCYSVDEGAKPEAYLSADPPPSTKAAVRAFLNWANDNPQRWNDEFNLGMVESMFMTFPCTKLGN